MGGCFSGMRRWWRKEKFRQRYFELTGEDDPDINDSIELDDFRPSSMYNDVEDSGQNNTFPSSLPKTSLVTQSEYERLKSGTLDQLALDQKRLDEETRAREQEEEEDLRLEEEAMIKAQREAAKKAREARQQHGGISHPLASSSSGKKPKPVTLVHNPHAFGDPLTISGNSGLAGGLSPVQDSPSEVSFSKEGDVEHEDDFEAFLATVEKSLPSSGMSAEVDDEEFLVSNIF